MDRQDFARVGLNQFRPRVRGDSGGSVHADFDALRLWDLLTVEELAIVLSQGGSRNVPLRMRDRRRRIAEAIAYLNGFRGADGVAGGQPGQRDVRRAAPDAEP